MTPSPTNKPGDPPGRFREADRTAEYVAPRVSPPPRISVPASDPHGASLPALPGTPRVPFLRWFLRLAAFTLIALAAVAGATITALARFTPVGGDLALADLNARIRLLPAADGAGGSGAELFRLALTPDGSALTLVPMFMDSMPDPELRDRYVIGRLLNPPENAFFRAAVPNGTRLIAFHRVGGVVYVDLSAEFLDAAKAGRAAAELAVTSVVRTLTANNPDIRSVQILADGRPVPPDWGGPDLARPIGR